MYLPRIPPMVILGVIDLLSNIHAAAQLSEFSQISFLWAQARKVIKKNSSEKRTANPFCRTVTFFLS